MRREGEALIAVTRLSSMSRAAAAVAHERRGKQALAPPQNQRVAGPRRLDRCARSSSERAVSAAASESCSYRHSVDLPRRSSPITARTARQRSAPRSPQQVRGRAAAHRQQALGEKAEGVEAGP